MGRMSNIIEDAKKPLWPSFGVPAWLHSTVWPEANDPVCPKCGARVAWACRGDVGSGHCLLSGQSSLGRNDCDWRGKVRRTGSGTVEVSDG